jgi:ATP-dependent RNA helicase HelY
VAAWIETVRGSTAAVIEEQRPVRLEHRYLVGERGNDMLHLLATFTIDGDELRPNPEAARLDTRSAGRGGPHGRSRSRLRTPSRPEIVELLGAEGMLPAIDFVFSRAGCDQAVQQCLAAGLRLTDAAERAQLRAIANARTETLEAADLEVLRYGEWRAGLEAGFAAHHAGMVPPMKEAVEEAFALGLAKVVFATETLALGINMPARSVVIEKLSKFTGERHEFLTPGEYTQLTGRAGRRGIDERGYAVVCWSPFVPFDQVASLAARRTDALRSSFRPTYNMAANLVHRYGVAEARHLLNLSFAQFHADRDVVALERQLERSLAALERQRELVSSAHGNVAEYRALIAELETARRNRSAGRRIAEAMESLRPGDVLTVGRRGGRVVVLSHDHRRSGSARLLGLSAARGLVRLSSDDFDAPPRREGRIDLPQPFAPRSPAFRRTVTERLKRARLQANGERGDDRRIAALEESVANHPVAQDPSRDARLRAAAGTERLEREVARLERRVRGRSESLARQFDRVLRVLEAWGYVEGWSLTADGDRLSRLYVETDLVVAEAVREGLFDGLREAELAAVVSCCTYERRGSDGAVPMPPARWPTKVVAQRARALERIGRDLNANEDDAGLPETRPPDPGFTPYVYDWVAGELLADVLDDDEMTGGDFVRHVKQCIDLLRQVGDVTPNEHTRVTARAAADACHRGVVAASGVARP